MDGALHWYNIFNIFFPLLRFQTKLQAFHARLNAFKGRRSCRDLNLVNLNYQRAKFNVI